MIAVAAREAHRVTAGLHLPPDPDLYRSAAISQTLLNGAWLGDPFFAGEWNWYNPLVPAIVAVLHTLTGVPVLELYARGGVLLNMLAPVALWVVVRVLLGSGAGVAAVFAFLFLPPRFMPGWSTAGYWPWLFSSVFTQAVFYAGLLAVDSAGRSTAIRHWLVAGLALGVVFLGHTAPALIFGGVLVLAALRTWRRGASAGRSLALLASALGVAMVVSLPLVVSVVARYRLAVLNNVLSLYEFPETEPANILGFLGNHANAGGTLALIGLALIAFDRERRQRAWVIGYWGLVNGVILLLHYGKDALASVGVHIPQIVTAFHFFLFAEAIVVILAGYAIWRLIELVVKVLPDRSSRLTPVVARVMLVAIVAASVGPALPKRRAREDFDESRQRALQYQSRKDDEVVRRWIRESAQPGAVFLASYRMSLYVVAPSGGKVVALDPVFANPYVNLAARERDQYRMEERIHENDRNGFCAVAPRYQVQYVVGDTQQRELSVPAGTFLEEILSTGAVRVFRAPDCGVRPVG
jgi:hypothetical protein